MKLEKLFLKTSHKKDGGSKIIENLAEDLRKEFPNMKGVSLRNLRYMRLFVESYPAEIVQQIVAQLSWGHNIALLDKISFDKREWYVKKAIENGWSRNVMIH